MQLKAHGSQIPNGRVSVSGAKNAATRLMAAAMLTDENVALSNFPTELIDVRHTGRFINDLGGQVDYDERLETVSINSSGLEEKRLTSYNYPIRTTYLLAAGQLLRFGKALIPYPGGCKLGERKYDLHLYVWKQLGCEVTEQEDHIEILAGKNGLAGNLIDFPITTIGGTENALLCAVISKGTTTIRNAYISPEVQNLIDLLRLMGARISFEGGSLITVEGVEKLHGTTIDIIPDRIEALTWMVYAALSGGSLLIEHVPFQLMKIPLMHLRNAGLDYFANERSVYISPDCFTKHSLQPFELACGTHPGVISDMQPFYVLLAMKAAGKSLIVDYRYPKRTAFLDELAKFAPGAIAWKSDQTAMIHVNGPVGFQGAEVKSTDLRGSMTLLLAALLAEGESIVHDVEMALRGYNKLEEKLKCLGVNFTISGKV